ncbi:hypothetical protein [Effusibacillus consociatus]|uniref:Transcriptional regulator n=1 Tax=Effusibacillus consociatus TaxID=1117041 RepID=A0ABV9Q7S6_9BACL
MIRNGEFYLIHEMRKLTKLKLMFRQVAVDVRLTTRKGLAA